MNKDSSDFKRRNTLAVIRILVYKEAAKVKPCRVVREVETTGGRGGLQQLIKHLYEMFARKFEKETWSMKLRIELNIFVDKHLQCSFY